MLKTPWTTSPGSFYTLRGQKLFRRNSILALVSANSFFWSLSTDHDHRWRVCRSTGRLFMVSYHLTPTDKHRVPSLLIPHQFICLSTFASLGKLPRYLNPPPPRAATHPEWALHTFMAQSISFRLSTPALWSKFCCGSRFGDIIQQ